MRLVWVLSSSSLKGIYLFILSSVNEHQSRNMQTYFGCISFKSQVSQPSSSCFFHALALISSLERPCPVFQDGLGDRVSRKAGDGSNAGSSGLVPSNSLLVDANALEFVLILRGWAFSREISRIILFAAMKFEFKGLPSATYTKFTLQVKKKLHRWIRHPSSYQVSGSQNPSLSRSSDSEIVLEHKPLWMVSMCFRTCSTRPRECKNFFTEAAGCIGC